MLEKFKSQARSAVAKKQKELNNLQKQKEDHEAQIVKIRDRIKERKIKAFWSDEEESEEEPLPFKPEASMEQYLLAKAKRKKAKIEIVKFVRKFREENNGANPTDDDTGPIAAELADFNAVNEEYLDIKLELIKNSKMPFEADEFKVPSAATTGGVDRTKTKVPADWTATQKKEKAQDKFMATLGQGFGLAASAARNDVMSPKQSQGVNESRVNQSFAAVPNFYEERCKELEEEIEELRAIEGDDENSKIAQFIKQLKEKDNLLAQRDKKLDELAHDNNLVTEERDKLKKQLERRKTVHPAQLAAQLPSSTTVDRSGIGSAGASS